MIRRYLTGTEQACPASRALPPGPDHTLPNHTGPGPPAPRCPGRPERYPGLTAYRSSIHGRTSK